MSQFLYFIAHKGNGLLDPAAITAAGLGYAMAGRSVQQRGTGSGPGGEEGILLSFQPPGEVASPPTYSKDGQRWRKAGGYWIGLSTDRPAPGPQDLRREKFIAGEPVKLADGNEWTIPIARAIVSGQSLPQRLVLGEDNETWELRELPEFSQICADARRIFDSIEQAENAGEGQIRVQFDLQESIAICIRALGVNYRVTQFEIDLLGLLTTDNRWTVMKALTDFLAVERFQAMEAGGSHEKKDPSPSGESPTSGGGLVG